MAKKKPRTVSSRRVAKTREFAPDYTFIKKDLKRIGIMAAGFFVILVAASFFLG
jgi:hypothetical protein